MDTVAVYDFVIIISTYRPIQKVAVKSAEGQPLHKVIISNINNNLHDCNTM